MSSLPSFQNKDTNAIETSADAPENVDNTNCGDIEQNCESSDNKETNLGPPSIMKCNITKIWPSQKIKLKRKYCKEGENSLGNTDPKTTGNSKGLDRKSDESSGYYKTWESKFQSKLEGSLSTKKQPLEVSGIRAKSSKFDLSSAAKRKNVGNENKIQIGESSNQKKAKYSCDKCNRTYGSYDVLKTHIRKVHFQQKICEICGDSFAWKSELTLHMDRVHPETSDKRYSCTVCGKRYNVKAQLEIHLRFHADAFKCLICGLNLCNQQSLVGHIRRKHTDELPFGCTVCDKFYPTKHDLKSHFRRVHLEEKSFSCHICKKSFFAKKSLVTHIESHKKNYCTICETKFTGYYAYETHLPHCRGKRTNPSETYSFTKLDLMRRK